MTIARIQAIPPDSAEGELTQLYAAIGSARGGVRGVQAQSQIVGLFSAPA